MVTLAAISKQHSKIGIRTTMIQGKKVLALTPARDSRQRWQQRPAWEKHTTILWKTAISPCNLCSQSFKIY